MKSKVIISLFETVRLSVSISPRNLYNSLKSIKENEIQGLISEKITHSQHTTMTLPQYRRHQRTKAFVAISKDTLRWWDRISLNLEEFLQEQRLHSERETWAILRRFGYSSLISEPDMIWLWEPEKNIPFFNFNKTVDSKTEKYQK